MKGLIVALAMLGMTAAPAVSQTMQAPTMGALSPTDVGIEPMMRLAAPLYAKLALVNEMRTIGAAEAAMADPRSRASWAWAKAIVRVHQMALRDLREIPAATSQLRSAQAVAVRDIAASRKWQPGGFAEVQLDLQRHAWALHTGYAADGRDLALRSFARAAVIRAESDLRRLPMRPMKY